jgi:arsenate reductase (glutaredoxin)
MSNTIYHYEKCSKSTGAMAILEARGIEAEVIDYLVAPPSVETLERIYAMLGGSIFSMLRIDNPLFTELGYSTNDQRPDREWFELIQKHPILLQRPIVIIGDRAVIARPSERLLELLP